MLMEFGAFAKRGKRGCGLLLTQSLIEEGVVICLAGVGEVGGLGNEASERKEYKEGEMMSPFFSSLIRYVLTTVHGSCPIFALFLVLLSVLLHTRLKEAHKGGDWTELAYCVICLGGILF